MPTFVAQVKDSSGKISRQRVEATSVQQAFTQLKRQYPAVGRIQQAGTGLLDMELKLSLPWASGVSVKNKAIFSRQLSAMVDAGVPIVRGLGVLGEQASNPTLKKSLQAISADVQQGISLSESMGKHPKCFDRLYVSMIEAGETGGVLDEVLQRLAKLLEDIARLQNQIRSALTYPTFVALFAVAVFLGMTIFLIPIFANIFKGLGAELPALTQFMLFISEILRSWLVLIPIVAIFATSFFLVQYYRTPAGRLNIDALCLKLPLFGDLIRKSAVARFCRVFGSLSRSGVPILNSLEIVSETVGNQVIANAVTAVRGEIQQGGMVSTALEKRKVFPALAIQMISIGEETGELDAMIMKVADFYEDEVEQAVKALTSVLEPLMMIVVAGMVGVILISMYLPMLTVFDKIG
jgi:type IV pilus assembly protein PilC